MSGLILPPGMQQPQGSVETLIDLYDTEILAIEKVIGVLRESEGKTRHLEGFRQEVIERFAQAGFRVEVNVYTAGDESGREIPGVFIPEIVIRDRIKPEAAFDHARQAWEVQQDVLGIEGGPTVIKGNGAVGTPAKTVGFSSKD